MELEDVKFGGGYLYMCFDPHTYRSFPCHVVNDDIDDGASLIVEEHRADAIEPHIPKLAVDLRARYGDVAAR